MNNIKIKSPLNYTGNKYRILEQIMQFFPKQINCMVDLFCGGATVGLNTNAKKIIFVDNNERVINLLVYLANTNFDDFIKKCELIIDKYNLSYSYKYGYSYYRKQCDNINDNNGLKSYNRQGFYNLREDYNSIMDKNSDNANVMLYILMVYGFNNDIRFNSSGCFNLPVGKTDLNKMNVNKIKNYMDRIKSIEHEFVCMSFTNPDLEKIINTADFVYMDPPYLIGDAVYNSSWNEKMENRLLEFIDNLIKRKVNFCLSNVLNKVGSTNSNLLNWLDNNNNVDINDINYHYRSASYNKILRNSKEREVVISNKVYYENK